MSDDIIYTVKHLQLKSNIRGYVWRYGVARTRDAVVCQKLVGKEDFWGSLFLNNHGVLVKELNVVIFQGVPSFAIVCRM